jgi:AraC-like DNA-binding protein
MMRLARAAQLLEQDAGQISEVAYRVGYRDVDHFSKIFKQVHGVVPSAYGRVCE